MNNRNNKYLFIVGLSLFIELLVLALIHPYILDFESVSLVVVGLHIFIVTLFLAGMKNRFNTIFLFAFIARVAFLFWDVYAKDIFLLPNSGLDSEYFFKWAVKIGSDISLLSTHAGGIYSKTLGIVFYFIGPQRMLAQYFNVLFGLSVIFLIYKILLLLEIKPEIIKSIIFIAAFFPNSLIMSAILLREIIPTFFVAYSFYFFIKWFKFGETSNVILSLIMLGTASIFHSGVIGIFIGYAYVFLFYKREINRFRFSASTLFYFVVLTGATYLATVQFSDALFYKFNEFDEVSDIYKKANTRLGGSAYLTSIVISNPGQFFIYGPVRAFFFLTSPLPMNWRGGMDVFTFVFDSFFYLWAIFYLLKNWKWFKLRKSLIKGMVIMLIGVSFIFGIGVSNAGTAVRHRQKILPIFLVLAAVMIDEKKSTIGKNYKMVDYY